jgi:tetrahydromethanopterin S-methyltransferase subunit F
MNSETPDVNRASGAALGFVVASLIFVVLVVVVKFSVHVPAIDADASATRAKALAEIRAIENQSLNTAGWVDQSRGIVRLPIDTAVQETIQAWRNPVQARADLIARQQKASQPAPAAPAKPSAFE